MFMKEEIRIQLEEIVKELDISNSVTFENGVKQDEVIPVRKATLTKTLTTLTDKVREEERERIKFEINQLITMHNATKEKSPTRHWLRQDWVLQIVTNTTK